MTTHVQTAQFQANRVSLGHRIKVLAGLVLPALGVLVFLWLLTYRRLTFSQSILMVAGAVILYFYSGFGITVGYHRLLTHRSFKTTEWLRRSFTLAGASALQGPPIHWVADHRQHHLFSDKPGDPHSPKENSFLHAHMGWLFQHSAAVPEERAPDLFNDRFMVGVEKSYGLIAALSLVIVPALLGLAITGGDPIGLAYGAAWMGGARLFFLLHFTFCINSVCHTFGKREFRTSDESRDVWWLRLFTMGESNHNGHHAFPSSFKHGLKGGLDPSAALIELFEKIGLAWNLRRVPPEELAAKAIA